jgi:hypothetical protein
VIASLSFGAFAIRSAVRYAGQKRLRDDDVGVHQLAFEHGVGAVLVRGDDQRMTLPFQESAQAELSRNAAQELAGVEVDTSRCGQGLTIGIAFERWDVIPCVGTRVSVHGVVVEDANDLRHSLSSL